MAQKKSRGGIIFPVLPIQLCEKNRGVDCIRIPIQRRLGELLGLCSSSQTVQEKWPSRLVRPVEWRSQPLGNIVGAA